MNAPLEMDIRTEVAMSKAESSRARIDLRLTPERLAVFLSRVERIPESGCWIWMAGTSSTGYGTFAINQVSRKAHRIGYTNLVGPIPDGKILCHRCDVTYCVNPAHLYIGTFLDNSGDMIRRMRGCQGEKMWMSKLTEAQALEIIQATGKRGFKSELARKLGVTEALIWHIRKGRAWKHLHRQAASNSENCSSNSAPNS